MLRRFCIAPSAVGRRADNEQRLMTDRQSGERDLGEEKKREVKEEKRESRACSRQKWRQEACESEDQKEGEIGKWEGGMDLVRKAWIEERSEGHSGPTASL